MWLMRLISDEFCPRPREFGQRNIQDTGLLCQRRCGGEERCRCAENRCALRWWWCRGRHQWRHERRRRRWKLMLLTGSYRLGSTLTFRSWWVVEFDTKRRSFFAWNRICSVCADCRHHTTLADRTNSILLYTYTNQITIYIYCFSVLNGYLLFW